MEINLREVVDALGARLGDAQVQTEIYRAWLHEIEREKVALAARVTELEDNDSPQGEDDPPHETVVIPISITVDRFVKLVDEQTGIPADELKRSFGEMRTIKAEVSCKIYLDGTGLDTAGVKLVE